MIEQHNTIIIIPARMASIRLPGKPLADINGDQSDRESGREVEVREVARIAADEEQRVRRALQCGHAGDEEEEERRGADECTGSYERQLEQVRDVPKQPCFLRRGSV